MLSRWIEWAPPRKLFGILWVPFSTTYICDINCTVVMLLHTPYRKTLSCPFTLWGLPILLTLAKEDSAKVKVLKETLYPPRGGLDDAILKKVPQAGGCLVGWLGSQAFGHLPKQICVEYQLICWYTYLISCSEIILGPTKNSLRIISSPRVTFDKSFHLWWEAPYRWRHACLSKLQAYLVAERAAVRYHPLLSEGLDGP